MERQLGVLLPVFSLPGRNGIGDFGKQAYQFIDILFESGVKLWQILPLNPVGFGNSPYQPYSSYAGEELYISIELLHELGLCELGNDFHKDIESVAYDKVRIYKRTFFHQAFQNYPKNLEIVHDFEQFKLNNSWVKEYALFINLKKKYSLLSWLEWNNYDKEFDIKKDYGICEEHLNYEMFIQFLFYQQWFHLKEYANQKGIRIMGDIPFYVGIDSHDVWKNKDCFLLDERGYPTFVAGVPPDYFSETGQRWGNPIYNWDYMSEHHFDFWVERINWSSKMYDIMRIDHFRAFDTYWRIPASCETAVEGEWLEAPGYALFDELYKRLGDVEIVAEDLGDLRVEVVELRDYYQLLGMNVVQFELNLNELGVNLEGRKSAILYTGTHDNQTLLGWIETRGSIELENLYETFGGTTKEELVEAMVITMLNRAYHLVILPIQDILVLPDSARINVPGTVGSPNWEWKLNNLENLTKKMKELTVHIKESNRY